MLLNVIYVILAQCGCLVIYKAAFDYNMFAIVCLDNSFGVQS